MQLKFRTGPTDIEVGDYVRYNGKVLRVMCIYTESTYVALKCEYPDTLYNHLFVFGDMYPIPNLEKV